MYYDNLFGTSNAKISNSLFDVNKQIASGIKIQYANEDVTAFIKTMQLDNEVTVLGQVKKSIESGYKVSNQTDTILNEFGTSMTRMRTLLINAANGTHDEASLDAIAAEMRGLEGHFKNLANTSIDGRFLFSGSAVDIKPIGDDGIYNGNNGVLKAFLGSQSQQQYNLSGAELFLGEESLVKREVVSNVSNKNLSTKYPDFTNASVGGSSINLTSNDTIRDLMGDTDNSSVPANNHYFYLSGAKSDGIAFNEKILMQDDDKIEELLNKIGRAYGNSTTLKLVNVSMNSSGQIVVEDKIKGSSKIDFHMVGAVDFSGGLAADVTDTSNLDGGEANFDNIIYGTSTASNPDLHVKEFMKSSFSSSANIEGIVYDRAEFKKNGSKLSSNVAQILKDTNAFAIPSTKISEVADLSQGTANTLDGTQFKLTGNDINGNTYNVNIDFSSAGSTFTDIINGNTYNIFDMGNPKAAVTADNMSYQQLMDVVNMAVSGFFPITNSSADYDAAIQDSKTTSQVTLSHDGKIEFSDATSSNTKATLTLFDVNSGTFGGDSSVMAFHANNALTIRDPKTDFFKTINEMITAVENYKLYPDASYGNTRNAGIENAITMMDDLQDHVQRSHAKVGSQSNALTNSLERTQILEISTMSLRSSVIDTDLAEASLKLTQLTLNYEAMLSTVGRVSKLSLVNYL
jgi:flagellar hook-associated protein 3 FlgL